MYFFIIIERTDPEAENKPPLNYYNIDKKAECRIEFFAFRRRCEKTSSKATNAEHWMSR